MKTRKIILTSGKKVKCILIFRFYNKYVEYQNIVHLPVKLWFHDVTIRFVVSVSARTKECRKPSPSKHGLRCVTFVVKIQVICMTIRIIFITMA